MNKWLKYGLEVMRAPLTLARLREDLDALRRECKLVVPVSPGTILTRFEDFILGLPADDADLIASYTFQNNIELGFRGLFTALVREGMTVVDVGAHVGTYTLLASRGVGDRGRVLSFEPNPRIFEFLRANVSRTAYQGRVSLHNLAVCDQHDGRLSFAVSGESSRNSSLHFDPAAPEQKLIEVGTVSLDAMLAPGTRLDVVKIDAEGAEASTLRGMERLIRENPDLLVFMEFAPEHLTRAGESAESLLQWISRHHFLLHRIADFVPTCEALSAQELMRLPAANLLLSRKPLPGFVLGRSSRIP